MKTRLLPLLAALSIVALSLAVAGAAAAQTQLTLDDFDDAGLDVEFAALIEVGDSSTTAWTIFYQTSPRTPDVGTLVDGDLNVGPTDVPITRVRQAFADGDLQLADSDTSFDMGAYFETGDGNDLTLYLQDDTTILSDLALTFHGASGGGFRLDLTAEAQTLLQNLPDGDRLIIAFARPEPAIDRPAQVTGVTATADDYDSITVQWTAVTDADGYVVEWDDDSSFGSSSEATISSGSTTSYQITGLSENTEYHVRVYATKTGAVDGDVSATANATTELQPPAQVTGLSATVNSDTEIALTWNAAARAGDYLVEWGTASGSYTDSAAASGNSHTVSGLTHGTTYYFRVTARRNNADDGTASAEESATTDPPDPPGQVTGVAASAASSSGINVEWDAATDADGYRVEWGTASGSYTDDDTTSSTSYAITSLSAGTTYYLRVVATRTDADDGVPSDEASAATDAATLPAPAQVTGVRATVDDFQSITVEWTAVTDADGYVVEWDDDSAFGSSDQANISSGSTTSYQITGLTEDTEYRVKVHATRTGADDGPESAVDTATTELQTPAQVSGLLVGSMTDVSVSLSWMMAVRADGYRVQWRRTSGTPESWSVSRETHVAALMHTVTGLTGDTGYQFRVISTRTGAADGAPSTAASATTDTTPTPAQVTGVTATALSGSEIQVTWNAAANATGYLVQWDDLATFADPRQARASGAGVVIEFLQAETEYFVRVYGTRAGAPDGALSATDSATTLEPPIDSFIERTPGGPVAGQLLLTVFAGVLAGYRFKSMKSPRREAVVTGAMSAGALILPAFGFGNNFWIIGVALLVLLSSCAVVFMASRR